MVGPYATGKDAMNRDDAGPSGQDPKKDYLEQGKQFASDVRDRVSKKVADNEGTLRGTLGKAARFLDEKTGGKYSEQIGKAETAVGDGIGRVAAQSGGQADPQAPGATAGDGTDPPPGHRGPAAGPDGPMPGSSGREDPDPPTTPR